MIRKILRFVALCALLACFMIATALVMMYVPRFADMFYIVLLVSCVAGLLWMIAND